MKKSLPYYEYSLSYLKVSTYGFTVTIFLLIGFLLTHYERIAFLVPHQTVQTVWFPLTLLFVMAFVFIRNAFTSAMKEDGITGLSVIAFFATFFFVITCHSTHEYLPILFGIVSAVTFWTGIYFWRRNLWWRDTIWGNGLIMTGLVLGILFWHWYFAPLEFDKIDTIPVLIVCVSAILTAVGASLLWKGPEALGSLVWSFFVRVVNLGLLCVLIFI